MSKNSVANSPVSASGATSQERITRCYAIAREALLAERNAAGYWTGELSTSALSTATAVMALEMVRRAGTGQGSGGRGQGSEVGSQGSGVRSQGSGVRSQGSGLRGQDSEAALTTHHSRLPSLIAGGLRWLAEHQNADGGWGDTVKSLSNISTTMLAHASFHAGGDAEKYRSTVDAARGYIDRAGGVPAVLERYGRDRTFSIPILTHCALAGLVDWRNVIPLPFELACLPARFYKTVRLPVVSYALPALIAIGQARFHHRKPWNPLTRAVRSLAVKPSLRVLERIQPSNGGFLEATPLTSFVTMSLASICQADHPVARRGVEFIVNSVRPDGSWPIDTNLATWVTTLSVNALGPDLPEEDRPVIREWLLGQQYREMHPYTNADPGGWAWTDLPGGVPDADDTPGAILALENLGTVRSIREQESNSLRAAVRWLLDLQNRDGGWPTFCRGWGALPFDRSGADLTAHAIRALLHGVDPDLLRGIADGDHMFVTVDWVPGQPSCTEAVKAVQAGFRYLVGSQRPDGSWLPLWFGNQHAPDDINPTYGTARVLAAYRDAERLDSEPAQRGLRWLRENQNDDGGWGGVRGTPSSVEETALAVDVLLSDDPHCASVQRGLEWLLEKVEGGTFTEASPIGFYFAKLWYFERLYPLAFTVAALRRARECFAMTNVERSARQGAARNESG